MQEMDVTEIRLMDIRDAYTCLTSLQGVSASTRNQVRFGIKCKFDLYDYLRGRYTEKWKQGRFFFPRLGKSYKASDLYTEIDARNTLAKQTIIDIIGQRSWSQPRS